MFDGLGLMLGMNVQRAGLLAAKLIGCHGYCVDGGGNAAGLVAGPRWIVRTAVAAGLVAGPR